MIIHFVEVPNRVQTWLIECLELASQLAPADAAATFSQAELSARISKMIDITMTS